MDTWLVTHSDLWSFIKQPTPFPVTVTDLQFNFSYFNFFFICYGRYLL